MRRLSDLRPGHHVAWVTAADENDDAVMLALMRDGLERGEKVMLLVPLSARQQTLARLAETGLDAGTHLACGQLIITHQILSEPPGGLSPPQALSRAVRLECEAVLKAGFSALRIISDATWAGEELLSTRNLSRYEAELNRGLQGLPCLLVCKYDSRIVEPALLIEVLRTHPLVIVGGEPCENVYYMPKDELLSSDPVDAVLSQWLWNLREIKRTREELQAERDFMFKRYTLVLDAMRRISALIARKPDRDQLLQGICSLLTERGCYEWAAIVLVDEEGRPQALFCSGLESAKQVLREGLTGGELQAVLAQALDRQDLKVWGPEAPVNGFPALRAASAGRCIALRRLAWANCVYGMMLVATPQGVPAPKQDRRNLFEELADDVSFALHDHEDEEQRRQAEEALRENERRFHEMAELLPDAVYEADTNLCITYGNQAVRELLGYNDDDLERGLYITEILRSDQVERAKAALQAAARSQGILASVYDLKRADGSYVACELRSSAVFDSQERLIGFRGVLRDITHRRKLEEAQRFVSLGHLAAGVAHEINNILAAMLGRAELAQALGTQEAYHKLANTVLKEAVRGAEMTRNLLRFARPAQPRSTPIALEDSIDAALEMAQPECQKADIEILRDYRALGHKVIGDADQLEQVFLNLIINAVHAMPHGGVLTISTEYVEEGPDQCVVVARVTDTGVGIEPEHLPHLFEPFFTTKRDSPDGHFGSGLGLSISYSIVAAHGGTMTVRSEPGVGTTLEVRLQACTREAEPEPQPQPAAMLTDSDLRAGLRVLIVEDEDDIRETLSCAFVQDGYVVETATSTQSAIEALRGSSYDLVISDLVMPGGEAVDLVAAAQLTATKPPVLIITGVGDEASVREVLARGAAAVLSKPFRLSDLIEQARQVLAQHREADGAPAADPDA